MTRKYWLAIAGIAAIGFVALRGGSHSTAPLSLLTSAASQVVTGMSITVPSNWTVQSLGAQDVLVSNVAQLSSMEAGATGEASVRIRRLEMANPQRLPLQQWFDSYYRNGFDGPIESRVTTSVDGHPALVVDVQASGRYRLTYVSKDADVYLLSFSTLDQRFLVDYDVLLKSVRFPQ